MGKGSSLRRKPAQRDPYPRILLVCEGVTEETYFQHLRHVERIPINLDIRNGATPLTLVQWAVEMKNHAANESRRDPNAGFEEVWCVFDVDEHPRIPEAKKLAADNGIQTAISNPCIELWLLLHFQDQRAHIHRHKAQSICKKHMPGYHKQPPCALLHDLCEEALVRAKELDRWQSGRNKIGENPSTQVYRLVDGIRSFRKLKEPRGPANIAKAKRILRKSGKGQPPLPGDELSPSTRK